MLGVSWDWAVAMAFFKALKTAIWSLSFMGIHWTLMMQMHSNLQPQDSFILTHFALECSEVRCSFSLQLEDYFSQFHGIRATEFLNLV